MHRRVPRFHIDFARPPLLSSKGQQILSHSFLFSAFQEKCAFPAGEIKNRSCSRYSGLRTPGSSSMYKYFSMRTLKRGHKEKATAEPCEHVFIHEDVSCAYAMLLQAMVILTCPLQTVMHGLATRDSNNPLCFLLLWMGLCNAPRQRSGKPVCPISRSEQEQRAARAKSSL